MSSHDYKSAKRPDPDSVLVAIADYAHAAKIDSEQAYEHRALLPHGYARVRLPGAEVSGVHAACSGRWCPAR